MGERVLRVVQPGAFEPAGAGHLAPGEHPRVRNARPDSEELPHGGPELLEIVDRPAPQVVVVGEPAPGALLGDLHESAETGGLAGVGCWRPPRRGDRALGGVQLGHCRSLPDRAALVLQPCRLVGQVVGVLDRHGEVGELECQSLEATDRASEGMALLGVVDGVLQACPRAPQRERRDRDPAVVEDREEVAEPVSGLAEQVGLGHPTAVEEEAVGVAGVPAELAVPGLDDEARSVGRHDERGDAVLGASGDCDDRGDFRTAVGDERLATVDHPLVTSEAGPGPGGAGVTAAVGLGKPECAERATGDEVGQPAVLLFLVAELVDRVGAQADPCRQRDPHRLVDAADLLDSHAQRGEVAVTPTPPFGEDEPEQPEIAHRSRDFDGEVVVAVPLGGVRCDLRLGEVAHDIAEHLVVVAQFPTAHGCSSGSSWLAFSRLSGTSTAEIVTTGSSRPTGCPWRAWTAVTLPSTDAINVCSIFIASMIATFCPAAITSPSATSTAVATPGMGLRIVPWPAASASGRRWSARGLWSRIGPATTDAVRGDASSIMASTVEPPWKRSATDTVPRLGTSRRRRTQDGPPCRHPTAACHGSAAPLASSRGSTAAPTTAASGTSAVTRASPRRSTSPVSRRPERTSSSARSCRRNPTLVVTPRTAVDDRAASSRRSASSRSAPWAITLASIGS